MGHLRPAVGDGAVTCIHCGAQYAYQCRQGLCVINEPSPEGNPTLQSLYRRRSNLKFWLQHMRNDASWSRDVDLERRGSNLASAITWQIIDLDERIRECEYGLAAWTDTHGSE